MLCGAAFAEHSLEVHMWEPMKAGECMLVRSVLRATGAIVQVLRFRRPGRTAQKRARPPRGIDEVLDPWQVGSAPEFRRVFGGNSGRQRDAHFDGRGHVPLMPQLRRAWPHVTG